MPSRIPALVIDLNLIMTIPEPPLPPYALEFAPPPPPPLPVFSVALTPILLGPTSPSPPLPPPPAPDHDPPAPAAPDHALPAPTPPPPH